MFEFRQFPVHLCKNSIFLFLKFLKKFELKKWETTNPSRILKMSNQHDFILTLVKAGKSVYQVETLIKDSYGDQAFTKRSIQRIMKAVKEGGDGKDERSGSKPWVRTPDNIGLIHDLIKDNGRLTLHDLSLQTNMNETTIYRILTINLGLVIKCARWVPRLLTAEQKQERVRCCSAWKKLFWLNGNHFPGSIITMDETMLPEYIPERKRDSYQWLPKGSKAPIKAKRQESRRKSMVFAYFDQNGMIYSTVAPVGTSINATYFVDVLANFLKVLKCKRPNISSANDFFFHMDNCSIHTAGITKEFMAKRGFNVLEHPPYSPDLAPADYFLFPKVKDLLAGVEGNGASPKCRWERAVRMIPKDSFLDACKKWPERWDRAIEREGNYVEK